MYVYVSGLFKEHARFYRWLVRGERFKRKGVRAYKNESCVKRCTYDCKSVRLLSRKGRRRGKHGMSCLLDWERSEEATGFTNTGVYFFLLRTLSSCFDRFINIVIRPKTGNRRDRRSVLYIGKKRSKFCLFLRYDPETDQSKFPVKKKKFKLHEIFIRRHFDG